MLEEELKAMSPDMGAIEAYARKDAEYATRMTELDDANAQRDEVRIFPSCMASCASIASFDILRCRGLWHVSDSGWGRKRVATHLQLSPTAPSC